jgi:hypothetical protein
VRWRLEEVGKYQPDFEIRKPRKTCATRAAGARSSGERRRLVRHTTPAQLNTHRATMSDLDWGERYPPSVSSPGPIHPAHKRQTLPPSRQTAQQTTPFLPLLAGPATSRLPSPQRCAAPPPGALLTFENAFTAPRRLPSSRVTLPPSRLPSRSKLTKHPVPISHLKRSSPSPGFVFASPSVRPQSPPPSCAHSCPLPTQRSRRPRPSASATPLAFPPSPHSNNPSHLQLVSHLDQTNNPHRAQTTMTSR